VRGPLSEAPAARSWHVGEWSGLAWLETTLKVAGIAVGIAALMTALDHPADGASGVRLAGTIILAVLSLGLVAAIADRVADREVVGVVFILGMNVGHWAMTVALARDPDIGGLLLAFAGLMLAGDLVKLAFLATSDFTVRSVPPAVVYGLTSVYAVGYVVLIVIAAAI